MAPSRSAAAPPRISRFWQVIAAVLVISALSATSVAACILDVACTAEAWDETSISWTRSATSSALLLQELRVDDVAYANISAAASNETVVAGLSVDGNLRRPPCRDSRGQTHTFFPRPFLLPLAARSSAQFFAALPDGKRGMERNLRKRYVHANAPGSCDPGGARLL